MNLVALHFLHWVTKKQHFNDESNLTENLEELQSVNKRDLWNICLGRNTFVRSIRPKLGLNLSTKGIVPHSD